MAHPGSATGSLVPGYSQLIIAVNCSNEVTTVLEHQLNIKPISMNKSLQQHDVLFVVINEHSPGR